MKNSYFFSPIKITFLAIFGAAIVFFTSGYVSKPPTGKTGAPNEGTCMDCHMQVSTTIDGEILLSGLPDKIVPGTAYDLMVTVKKTAGEPVYAGFELTALDSEDNKSGTFDLAGSTTANIQQTSLRDYTRHDEALNFDSGTEVAWMFRWTAPSDGSLVKFYAAAILADKANGNKDDKVVVFTEEVPMEVTSSAKETLFNQQVLLSPNPTSDIFNIKMEGRTESLINVAISDMTGRIISTQKISANESINVSEVPNGIYQVRIEVGDLVGSKLLLVQH